MAFDLKKLIENPAGDGEGAYKAAPLAGTRSQSRQRLQVGLSGVGLILLMLVVVDVVVDRTARTEAEIVQTDPDVIAAEETAPAQTDPLADAGVVPDLPVEPTPGPTPSADVQPDTTAKPGAETDVAE